jgi:hypothetical protein
VPKSDYHITRLGNTEVSYISTYFTLQFINDHYLAFGNSEFETLFVFNNYVQINYFTVQHLNISSGGELLEIRLLDNHLLDTFGRKSTAQQKIYQLLESSKCLLNWI